MSGMHERAAQVLADLARVADLEARGLEDVLATITETAARTLRIQRVNIWLHDPERRSITCIEDWDSARDDHESGAVLRVEHSPRYFAALEQLREVVAFDVRSDPRMAGLAAYLRAHGVTAMLDAPILQSGRVVGVVCHEHVGGPRTFEEWETSFAAAIGDLVSLVLETERRVRAERDRRLLAEQLVRSRQIDSLGWVAAGVAHDLRNLLTVVFTNLDLLRRPGGHPQSVDAIERAAERARDLCTLLLDSSGRVPPVRALVDGERVLRDLLAMIDVKRKEGVTLGLVVDPAAPRLLAEEAAVQRVVLNLVTNALEALPPGGGRVTVSLGRGSPSDEPRWDFREDRAAPTAVLEVADDGRGMDDLVAERAIEPFFSTKTNGGTGSGFGLSTVLGAVRGHHGAFDLQTAPGKGTRVRVWFPTG